MRKMHKFILTFAMALYSMAVLAQNGFNYQAVIRDANGNLVADKNISLRITLTNEAAGLTYYQERQTAQTNAYGVVSVVVGEGSVLSGYFSKVPWNSGDVYMKSEFDPNGGTNYALIGTTKLQSVPVAEYAKKTGELDSPSKLQIKAEVGTNADTALFAVKDEVGNVIFAVYKNGVRVYVDENDSKAAKSGFAVTGRSAKDGESNTYFEVNNNGTQVYVDDDPTQPGKAAKSKFAVTSVKKTNKDGDKAEVDNYLIINKQGTQIYVDGDDDTNKAAKSKFAVTSVKKGKTTTEDNVLVINEEGTKVFVDDTASGKAAKSRFAVTGKSAKGNDNYFVVNEAGTQVYIDDDGSKAAKSKFAVTGRSAKGDNNYMVINTDSTRFYIDEGGNAKAAKSGFAVTGRRASKGGSSNLFNIDLTKNAETLDSVNRVYWYPERNAFMAGNLQVDSAAQVGTNSFNAGFQNKAIGEYSQAMGYKSIAKGNYTTAIGKNANADKDNAYAFGNNARAIGVGSYAIGTDAYASGTSSYAIGSMGQDENGNPMSAPQATGDFAYAIGAGTQATYKNAIAIGAKCIASGFASIAMGRESKSTSNSSIAIGAFAKVTNYHSTAIGDNPKASGAYSTSLGNFTKATGEEAVALGSSTEASGSYAFAAGILSTSSGNAATAIGNKVEASGDYSTAVGSYTNTSGYYSSALGYQLTAKTCGETVVGIYNTDHSMVSNDVTVGSVSRLKGEDPLFIIGNGNTPFLASELTNYHALGPNGLTAVRSDALVVYKNGNAEFRGNVYPSHESNIWTEATSYNLGTKTHRWDTIYANYLCVNGEVTELLGEPSGSSYAGGDLSVTGDFTISGNIGSSLLPKSTRNYILGDPRYQWKEVHTYDLYVNGTLTGGGSTGIAVNTTLAPKYDNSYYLGKSGQQWREVYAVTINATTLNGTLSESSDIRLKTNIKPLEKALDKVLTLNGITYEWRTSEFPERHFDSKAHIGVVAQEVEKVLPELVNTDENGYKSVEYANLTPVLIEAIKEQQAIIDQQNKRIENLEKMLEELMKKQ